jgi:hypothetical protein
MTDELRLLVRQTQDTNPFLCVLCGQYAPAGPGRLALYEGSLPVGYVCPDCHAVGPLQASIRLRERARKRLAVAQAQGQEPVTGWRLWMLSSLVESAERLLNLADRLALLPQWSFETNP